MPDRYLSTGELAKLCHMTKHTVLAAIASGKLAASTTPGGHHRIHARDAVRFLRMHGLPTDALESRPQTVLVMSREDVVQQLLQSVLSAEAIATERAHSGFEAGMLTERLRPEVVVLDAPTVAEAEAVGRGLKGASGTGRPRLLVLSSSEDGRDEAALLAAGADAVLRKPFNVEALRRATMSLLAAGVGAAAGGR